MASPGTKRANRSATSREACERGAGIPIECRRSERESNSGGSLERLMEGAAG